MIRLSPVALAVLVAVSCAKGTPENPLLPPGVSPTPLQQPPYVGVGRYQKLGEVTLAQRFGGLSMVDFVEVRQPKGTSFAHADAPGWVYAYQGVHQLSRDGGERTSFVQPGAAAWVEADAEHFNATADDRMWYFVALRPIAERGAKLPYPDYRILYQTGDLGAAPSGKNLVHQLGYITMSAGGRTSSHSHGGAEAFYVIKGTVDLVMSGGVHRQVTAGQGASINPGVVMQLQVVGDEPVQILTYFITPEGAPWQNNLQMLP